MRFDMTRPLWCRLASLLAAALAAGCVTPGEAGAPAVASVQPPEGRPVSHAPRPSPVASTPTRPTSCPLPARVDGGYDLSQLPVFSKTLFYVRENSPLDLGPRARELAVGALLGAALQEKDIVVEGDSATPPRWVTVTVSDQRCTLNLDRVDAPWSLRSTLQDALRFVQGNLGPAAPGVEPAERLFRIEFAATNGMLSALDGRSALLDVETYQKVRPPRAKGQTPTSADGDVPHSQVTTKAGNASAETLSVGSRRVAPGSVVAYARLERFGPGVSAEVERWLAKSEAEQVKGLILDLRDNTGGLLDEAIKVADAFIKEGSLGAAVNKERGRQQHKEFAARNDGHEPGGALVVLVNHRTAAASELVAAAIKNLGRGVVMGDPTAGAATVRVLFDLPKGPLRTAPARHAASDRDIIQDVIDGKAPTPSPPPPVEPERDRELLGLLLATGRLLASGGAEIEGVGVAPDVQPACPAGERVRPDEDCLLLLAQEVIARAKDPQRSTLLSTAKELASPAARPRLTPL
jgi:hypothetical protein